MQPSKSITFALLMLGIAIAISFAISYHDAFAPAHVPQLLLLPLILLFSYLAPLRNATWTAIEKLRTPSRHAVIFIAIGIAIFSFGYLLISAWQAGRDLSPRIQDEFSYLIQSQLLAKGNLWLPQPVLADFFESFHILVKPVYASVYFPGTAMLYVPGVWLGFPPYFTSLAICSICVSLMYLLTLSLLDGAYALLAAMMLLTTSIFFLNSTLATSNVPALMFALIVLLTFIQWHRTERLHWLAAMGIASGWGMITRPVDLFAWLVPIALVVLFTLRRRTRRPWMALITLAIAAAPFAGLQLLFNHGVTGSWLTTPYRVYFDQFQPETGLGFGRDDPEIHPRTQLAQKIDLYEEFLRPMIREHQPDRIISALLQWRLQFAAAATMPSYWLLALLPLGFTRAWKQLGVGRVCMVVPILFLGVYAFYPYFLPYYALAIAPPIVLATLVGMDEMVRMFQFRRGAVVFMMLAVFGLCAAATPFARQDFSEGGFFQTPSLHNLNEEIDARIHPPAVILFAYAKPASFHEEPVYNYKEADPMTAPIMRAQDLGAERNRRIISYFARRRPETMFYRFRRYDGEMETLGTARALEVRGEGEPPSPTPQPAR